MTYILLCIKGNLLQSYIILKLITFCVFWNLFRSDIMLLKCLKIFWKSIDKKALRQGRHLMLLFPPPKIVLSKEETSRKTSKCCSNIAFLSVLFYIQLSFGMINFLRFRLFARLAILRDFQPKIYFLNIPHNLHHFVYFTTRYDFIC